MSKAILLVFVIVGLAYFLFYPFLKNAVNRKQLLKWFIIIYVIALLASTISAYFL